MFEDKLLYTVVVISFQNTMPPFTVYSKVMDSTAIHSVNHHPADKLDLNPYSVDISGWFNGSVQ